jgi:hypothetical protein
MAGKFTGVVGNPYAAKRVRANTGVKKIPVGSTAEVGEYV